MADAPAQGAQQAAPRVQLPPLGDVLPPEAPVLTIRTSLTVCGFNEREVDALIEQAIPNWSAFLRMTPKDIISMADDYGKRTIGDGRIVFGFFRTKELQGLMHWVQDMKRMSRDPSEQRLSPVEIALAAANNDIRTNMADNMETASKAADPGKLKTNTDWYTWSQGFINYLSTIPGCTGIPLSYVVREFDEPMDPEDDTDYLTTLVHRAPLQGTSYVADRRQVHQLLTGKVLGEQAEEWIRDDKTKQNGRIDFRNLQLHYEGEGNVSRRITQAEALHKSLFYKQERSMKFTVFLSRLQTMFQIYKQEGEDQPESAKIRFLLNRVQAPHLAQTVTNLQYHNDQGTLTYSFAKNSLMTAVVKSSDFSNNDRTVSSANTSSHTSKSGGNSKGNSKKGPHTKKQGNVKSPPKGDEKIPYTTWSKLTREQQAVIRKYRDDHGLPGGNNRAVAATTAASTTTGISDTDVARIVAAIEARNGSSTISSTISSVNGNAGQAFGGRNEATQRRVT
jgi:hypothetical protein